MQWSLKIPVLCDETKDIHLKVLDSEDYCDCKYIGNILIITSAICLCLTVKIT